MHLYDTSPIHGFLKRRKIYQILKDFCFFCGEKVDINMNVCQENVIKAFKVLHVPRKLENSESIVIIQTKDQLCFFMENHS